MFFSENCIIVFSVFYAYLYPFLLIIKKIFFLKKNLKQKFSRNLHDFVYILSENSK